MSITIFSPKHSLASKFLFFDFLSDLETTETITSYGCQCEVEVGTDPNPDAVLSGGTSVAGKIVTQLVTGGLVGVIYQISCNITTSLGQELTMYGRLAITDDNPY